ncbi:hypothetical protein HWV62_32507 [Athelia sp. TMB]|nr:hypothetical protein HWV62_32507 [Athelia sp. TMB]
MDGTLLDSLAGVIGAWELFATEYPGVDVQKLLGFIHGVRTAESLQKYCGINDPEELQREATRFEQAVLDHVDANGQSGIVKLPGVDKIMEALNPTDEKLPKPLWAICTSSTRNYATAALKRSGIPIPDVFVAAEDVKQGKPLPAPYIMGAEKLGIIGEEARAKCLVFEDAISGIISGNAAGCQTLAVLTTHRRDQLDPCNPTYLVKDLSKLFDMDGTLVDSSAGVVGAWELFAKSYPGIDVQDILSAAHGIRTVDNLRAYCGLTDPVQLEKEAERFEQAIVDTASGEGRQGIIRLPGVTEIMEELYADPESKWAICTSATRAYATKALKQAGVNVPKVFVAAEDVEKGKPAPDPYVKGAAGLGFHTAEARANTIVFEDAPNGILSGKAAGCQTLAVLTSHRRDRVEPTQPTFLVNDLTSVKLRRTGQGQLELKITTLI